MRRTIIVLSGALALAAASCAGGGGRNDARANAPDGVAPPGANAAAKAAANAASNAAGDDSGAGVPIARLPATRVEAPVAIEFALGGFPPGWDWIDPEKENPTRFEVAAGALRLIVPNGKDFAGDNRTAPRLLRTIAGDFTIATRLRFEPREPYQGAGLIVLRNDSDFLRLERAVGRDEIGGVRFERRAGEEFEALAAPARSATAAAVVELKISRAGRRFAAYWRAPGGAWREIGRYESDYPEKVRVGLVACNTGDPLAAEFADLRLTPRE